MSFWVQFDAYQIVWCSSFMKDFFSLDGVASVMNVLSN